jgi:hypothetical protein
VLEPKEGAVRGLSFSPLDGTLVSGGEDASAAAYRPTVWMLELAWPAASGLTARGY